jgi:hypothetical protein
MKSYTSLRNLYGSLTNDSASANLTLGDTLINDSIMALLSIRPWAFLEKTVDIDTVASQQAYSIPNSLRESLTDVYVTVGTTVYNPVPIISEIDWKAILMANLGESDNQSFWYREGSDIKLAPTPATAGNTITFRGRKKARDLSIADYSTGTVVSIANGAKAVVGNGTTWTASMAGRYIKIIESNTALKGDGEWYEIASVESATSLTLSKPYEGTAIAAGAAAYVIGQMSLIPEEYDIAPVYRAVALYYQTEDVTGISDRFWRMYDGGVEAGMTDTYGGVVGRMLNEGKDERRSVPPSKLVIPDPNWPERDLATGF